MPDKFDMPDWRDPSDQNKVWRWDPSSHRYVSGEDYEGDQPTEWSGVGQTLDPAQHRLKPQNPEQTGIMASYDSEQLAKGVEAEKEHADTVGGDMATIEQIAKDHLDEDPEYYTHLKKMEDKYVKKAYSDVPVAARCPNCNGHVVEGRCEDCNYQQFDAPHQPDAHLDMDTFPERVPKQNYLKTDHDYPTLASMRSFPEFESTWEHNLHLATKPSLESCPECGCGMTEGPHGAKCQDCGLKQPAVTATHRKEAILPLLAAGAARLLAPMAARALAGGAVAGATAEGAGAAGLGATAEGAGAGGLMSSVRSVMNPAMTAVNAMHPRQPAQVNTQQPPTGPVQQVPVIASDSASHSGTNEGWQIQFTQRGESDNPEHDGTRGFQEEHSDAPEFLKDVNDLGQSKTEGDVDLPSDWLDELHSMSDAQIEALTGFGRGLNRIVVISDGGEMEDGDADLIRQIDEALENAFPGYKDEGDKDNNKKDKKESRVSSHEMLEKVAARRPKLCPAHADITDASLIEGKSLLSQFAPANYGSNYCKSPDFEGKCNFKPAMTTQKYWDDKDAEAEQRRIEREQAAEQAKADELAGTTLDPNKYDVDLSGETPTDEAPASEGLDSGEYAPGLSEAPSAVGAPQEPVVASRTASIDVGTAVRKRSLNPSHDDPVGVVVEMTHVHPSSPGRATVRFEGGHEESIPVADLESADGGDIDHPTMDYAMDAGHPFEDEMGAPGQYSVPAGDMPYSYSSVKEADHDFGDPHHDGDADQFDFGHGAPAHQPDTAVANDGDGKAGIKDINGVPLKEGSSYLMTAEDYSVPDRVTIDKIAGPDITYTIHTSEMDFQDKMSAADIETQKLSFKPADEADKSEGSNDEVSDDVPVATEHPEADNAGHVEDAKVAGAARAEGCTCDEDLCECTPKKEASVNLDEHFMWSAPPVEKTAGKDYTPREIRELIDEGEGQLARNAGSMDLSGTHYVMDEILTDDSLW